MILSDTLLLIRAPTVRDNLALKGVIKDSIVRVCPSATLPARAPQSLPVRRDIYYSNYGKQIYDNSQRGKHPMLFVDGVTRWGKVVRA